MTRKYSLVESIWQGLEAPHNVLLPVVSSISAQSATEGHKRKKCLKQCL